MKWFIVPVAVILTALLLTAGCIGTDTPVQQSLSEKPLGTWVVMLTSETVNCTERYDSYELRLWENESGTVIYSHTEKVNNQTSTTTHQMEGPVIKNENAYTIVTENDGNFTLTFSTDTNYWGPEILTLPDGTEVTNELIYTVYETSSIDSAPSSTWDSPKEPVGLWTTTLPSKIVNGTEVVVNYSLLFLGNDTAAVTYEETQFNHEETEFYNYQTTTLLLTEEGTMTNEGNNYTITTDNLGNFTMICSFTEDGVWEAGPVVLPDGTLIADYWHLITYDNIYT
ncbi:hypothetical protein [Methanorbis furvi]|uniref:Uncharacterized protein n=1 Tax=Methanorbis furvi TaxID=3028299 RepID=A0AAE4MCT1_9EURY|nr:hypothetical protein [Methanocorpusculaceae archaeon Ag1]